MHILSLIRLLLLLFGAVGFFVLIRTQIISHTLKGFRFIAFGFGLIYVNIVVGSLFHSGLLPTEWNEEILPVVGFITGYFGQTIGLFLLLVGNYYLIQSLTPHLSEHYTSLVENALVGVYLLQEGVIVFVNARCAEIFGYAPDEVIGKPADRVIAPESRETVQENVRKRLSGETGSLHYDFIGMKKDGTKIKVEVFGSRTVYHGKPAIHGTLLDITERTRAEETLRESESRFRTVVESLGEGLIITDKDDNVIYLNSRMADLSGYSAAEMLGKRAYTLLLPEEEWDTMKRRNSDRIKGKAELYEILLRRKDGRRFWTEINATPYRDTNGTIIGTLAAVTDIEQRKHAGTLQSALYRIAEKTNSTEDLEDFFHSVHGIISELMFAKNFYIALYDPSTQMLSFPYFVDEVDPQPQPKKPGKGLTEHVLRTGKPLLASPEAFEKLMVAGEVESIGAPSIDWLGVPMKSGDTTFGAIVVQSYTESIRYGDHEQEILTFVSQHIATAIQRKADEERFRAVWEHSADGMRLTDEEGRVVMVNSAFCKIVKLRPEQMVGKFLSVMYLDDHEANVVDMYRRRFDSNTVATRFTGEITLWNHTEVPVEISNSFIVFGTKNKMLLSVFRDISERKQLEQQLLHAQKMESIGVLAGGIAHDFNNVLSMILTSAEMLKAKTKQNKSLQHYAEMVATAAERGGAIAKQLLMFARTEKSKLKPMPVAPIVLEVQKLLEHTLPKSISVKAEIETSNAVILGDSDQLHQALVNLALNSSDAIEARSTHGTIIFKVGTVNHDAIVKRFPKSEKGDYVVLSVWDNGIGMNEETQRRIFEPFFSTKERGKGTGLGLSIVHGIVQNHQGLIDVQSQENKGTTLTFYFPSAQGEDIRISKEPHRKKAIAGNNRGSVRTILIVDDEPALREMIREMLLEKDYKVITAFDGIDGLEQYEKFQGKIDLVISDLGMPRLGGEEMFRRLKEIDPEVKMVFTTGYLEEELKGEILRNGARDIIQKPFRIEQIVGCVAEVLGSVPTP